MPQGIDGYSNDLTPFQISQWIGKDGNGLGITLFDVWVYKAIAADRTMSSQGFE
jgi:hypothetical protein